MGGISGCINAIIERFTKLGDEGLIMFARVAPVQARSNGASEAVDDGEGLVAAAVAAAWLDRQRPCGTRIAILTFR